MNLQGRGPEPPAVMHVTHYKAGSQWILEILKGCVRDRVVHPEGEVAHFIGRRLEEGKVYPTLYVTREQFEAADLPRRWRRFVIIRDLRDTMVSAYFSIRYSHIIDGYPEIASFRSHIASMAEAEGMLQIARGGLRFEADMQRSWVDSGVELIKFEDLLDHDTEVLERVLIDDCELPASRRRVRRAIKRASFQRLSGGREPGQEDQASHWRKGVAGDWRNHFTDPVKEIFKERFGDILIATGYERDHDW